MSRFMRFAAVLGLGVAGLSACHHMAAVPDDCNGSVCDDPILSQRESSLEAIACDLDCMEKHIDRWGSITTKHPDVWGAARLTKYQQEVEQVFAAEATATNVNTLVMSYQGARSVSDQAFLSQAMAMNMALTGQQAGLLPPETIAVTAGTTATAPRNPPPAVPIPTAATIPTDLTTTTSINRTNATMTAMPGFSGPNGLRLEPSAILDEKKRFLDHLNEIRRVNEGDDTADSPGYALYLVRVPVSVLPGKRTDTGHGAEITLSVKPILGDDLLPVTFRNLVVNDMVDQFSELMVVALNDPESRQMILELLNSIAHQPDAGGKLTDDQNRKVQRLSSRIKPRYTSPRPSRNAEFAFPMNNLQELFGDTYLKALLIAAAQRYQDELVHHRVVHLHDVRAVVREQVVASYRFLSTANPNAWSHCTQELAQAVRDLNGNILKPGRNPVTHLRELYDKEIGRETGKENTAESDRLVFESLGWGILLESALLNDLLVRDIKETMVNKIGVTATEEWHHYFQPDPSPDARLAFNDYVACRWPVHTFAVDPVIEQQNIQDSMSQRREMQLALSLALASGNISGSSFTRYARRLEADYQTIDLNRTVVGFSHGDNTFGWRFYPRFQTPEIPGNLKVITRDLIAGRAFNKEQELRQRRLEPGQRECMALVVMPSFVPFAELNVSSSWFSLANPKQKNCSTKETLKLSKMVRSVELCNPKCDQDRYRPGEFQRLQAKAQMLSARLPLQDMKFQVPYENTLGGFEFFNSGLTDLAPQLRGWYGAGGYDGKALELFLLGDNFSINMTQVIAGGKKVVSQLLSRQVIRVELPADLAMSESTPGLHSPNGKYLDIRLATPYGIGGPLRIPMTAPPSLPPTLTLVPQPVFLDRETELAITGLYFTPDLQVFAEGKACTVTVLGRTTAKVVIPKGLTPTDAGRGLIELKVANAFGASTPVTLPVFPAPATAPPVLNEVTPQKIMLDRDSDLALTGRNFTPDMVVFVDGKACTATLLQATVAKVSIPKGLREGGDKDQVKLQVLAVTAGGASNVISVDAFKTKAAPGTP